MKRKKKERAQLHQKKKEECQKKKIEPSSMHVEVYDYSAE